MNKGLKKGLIILGVLVALVLVLGAAWLGETRLIDNVEVAVSGTPAGAV